MKTLAWLVPLSLMLAACANREPYNPMQDFEEVEATKVVDAPSATTSPEAAAAAARGEYLVELLGCGACHTDGALVGEPDMSKPLAGSNIGIAYTNPLENERPGIVYPSNITPHPDTGIGRWTDEQLTDVIRSGLGRHGRQRILVMPWQGYARMTEDDIAAIVTYLRSVEPIDNEVPLPVPVGTKAKAPYVHFGVYRSRGL
jgi:mono/diheme cytochrome c family protein